MRKVHGLTIGLSVALLLILSLGFSLAQGPVLSGVEGPAPRSGSAEGVVLAEPAGQEGAPGGPWFPPPYFNYQGLLLDSAGNPVPDGSYSLTFAIYDLCGATLWSEVQTVDVTAGLFSVLLGSVTEITPTLFSTWDSLSLGITLQGEPEMTPRIQLVSVPYAMNAGDVWGAAIHPDSVEVLTSYSNIAISGTVQWPRYTGDRTYGVYGQNLTTDGTGVYGKATATSGDTLGIYGEVASTAGRGVVGYASATTGITHGVYGWCRSPDCRGVVGYASASTGPGTGVVGTSASTAGRGVYGGATATTGTTWGVRGESSSTDGRGVSGYVPSTSGYTRGVDGQSDSTVGIGVFARAAATTGPNFGVWGDTFSTAGIGVYGLASATTGTTWGVYGKSSSTDGRGVFGTATATTGHTFAVSGDTFSPDGVAVWGWSHASTGANYGVYGKSDSMNGHGTGGLATDTTGSGYAYGAYGVTYSPWDGAGVYGVAASTVSGHVTYGVYGRNYSASGYGVYGRATSSTGNYGGYFYGNVAVTGNISKGGGSFKIDHPLDPTNKYLYHSFVESPDMLNVYNGNVILDEKGEGWVEMPAWFEALNRDLRYQLTCIGGYAPVYIAQEMAGNRFQIAGGTPGLKVSWLVTGVRQDPYANAHRIPVEEEKPADERGTYLYPDLYGQPETLGLHYKIHQGLGKAPAPLPAATGGE